MAGKFKIVFADFLRSARKLWLEMMGGLFLALAIMFTLHTVSAFRKTTDHFSTWDWRTGFTVFGSAFFSVLMLFFSFQSFWKSRKIR